MREKITNTLQKCKEENLGATETALEVCADIEVTLGLLVDVVDIINILHSRTTVETGEIALEICIYLYDVSEDVADGGVFDDDPVAKTAIAMPNRMVYITEETE